MVGLNAGDAINPRAARDRLAVELKTLRSWVRSIHRSRVSAGDICAGVPGANPTRFSEWINGRETPSPEAAWGVIKRMEGYAGGPLHPPQQWKEFLENAREEADNSRGSRLGNTYRATSPKPTTSLHTVAKHRRQELKGRQTELDQLYELVRSRVGYLALVAPPWSGKTALLATFAATRVPPKTDIIAYFIDSDRTSNTAQSFLATMSRELSAHMGKKRASAKNTAELLGLYEAAAMSSARNGRKLLLLIDGLDEDAEASPANQSIASLLPPKPYPGLVVLVGRRPYPPLPDDIPQDHPLRHAERIPGFRPSPEAAVERAAMLRDFTVLLKDSGTWGREIVGFLAVSGGGLTKRDLMELVRTGGHADMPIPFDLTMRLRSAASRGFCLEDLEPDTLALAHKDLYRVARDELGHHLCAELLERLDVWADGFRKRGWPATTPGYLLHRYLDRLQHADDAERRTIFTLDHRRLLRVTARGRSDLALASLDQVAAETPTPVVLASAAASKSLLETGHRSVPREVLRALCVVGDVERARSQALSVGAPASKAARLVDVVQALLTSKAPEAAERVPQLAREAIDWAEQVERQPAVAFPTAEWDTPSIVPHTVVVLAEAGLTDEAIRLLARVDIRRPENIEPVARAAGLLRGADRALSDRIMDELLLEAESQAESAEGDPVLAVEIWASVAAHAPGLSGRVLPRMKEFSEELAVVSPGLVAADCCALTASALAKAAREDTRAEAWNQARESAGIARNEVRKVRDTAQADELSDSLALLTQALLDLGELAEGIRDVLTPFGEIAVRAASLLGGSDLDSNTDDDGGGCEKDVESPLLRRIQHASDLGDGPQLRNHLDEYMKAVAERETRVAWLPFLSEALVRADGETGPTLDLLTGGELDPLLRVRALTAVALAHFGGGRHDQAMRYATQAEVTAEGMEPQIPEARALVAQAFAHVDEVERAASWAYPASGQRPFGKEGIRYQRAVMAVQAGLEPAAFVAWVVADDLTSGLITSAGTDLLAAFRSLVHGEQVEAHIASLRTVARARLRTEPMFATGLALLQAVCGDGAAACRTAGEVPDPDARGIAQAAVADCLAGIPVHLDVAGEEDDWTLSVLRVLAHHLRPAGAGAADLVPALVVGALGTGSWYRALPLLARTDPDAVHAVVEVLDHHRCTVADSAYVGTGNQA
ncbi:hypothetical protein ABZ512_10915 [Nocardiopsis dassonvillei]|uniref:hypothetical protein n=1 Tax=Nocardiopsis dassonvillei TaxID=2014 RepID=UPI0033EFAD32